jgi:hypothetical protein
MYSCTSRGACHPVRHSQARVNDSRELLCHVCPSSRRHKRPIKRAEPVLSLTHVHTYINAHTRTCTIITLLAFQVAFVPSYVLVLEDRDPSNALCCSEPVLSGPYLKHNNNDGVVATQRLVPQVCMFIYTYVYIHTCRSPQNHNNNYGVVAMKKLDIHTYTHDIHTYARVYTHTHTHTNTQYTHTYLAFAGIFAPIIIHDMNTHTHTYIHLLPLHAFSNFYTYISHKHTHTHTHTHIYYLCRHFRTSLSNAPTERY